MNGSPHCSFQELRLVFRVCAQWPLSLCVLVSSCWDNAAKQAVPQTPWHTTRGSYFSSFCVCELNGPRWIKVFTHLLFWNQLQFSGSGTWFKPLFWQMVGSWKPSQTIRHMQSLHHAHSMPTRVFTRPKQVTCPDPRQKDHTIASMRSILS